MANQDLKTEEALTRWVDKIYPSKEDFKRILRRKKKLTIYHGIDPTVPCLHLGHSTNFFLLKKFQKLGHRIILLIGDFTAQIGDPTGKLTTRKALTKKQILENCRTYQKQAEKILNFKSKKNPVELKFNSQWLSKLKMEEIIKLVANFTHGQIIKRNMFQERLKKKQEIYLHEFLYPLFQGYDSVAMDVDAEVGGTDQTFNMLIGRDLMKIYKNKEKFVITTPLLINPKTGRKLMSKTENFIALDYPLNEMYGQIMALPDEVLIDCFKLCTEIPLKEIKEIEKSLNRKKVNPRDLKARLAREIVSIYHGKKEALKAEEEFDRVFKEKKMPSEIPEIKLRAKRLHILDLLTKTKLARSRSAAKRLILQRGVKINNVVEKDWQKVIKIKKEMIVQVGKRKFLRLI
ncbi:tyrosine--tRNA ligase [Patescibacteria group bacterium]|nr:tyrosine--tRNA ligase [Patescibacteria group bacterium]